MTKRVRRAVVLSFIFGIAGARAAPAPGFLGLEFDRMTAAAAARTPLREAHGALIVDVVAGSPADRAGIRIGEVLAAIDGTEIASAREASDMVKAHHAGDRVVLTLFNVNSGDIHPEHVAVVFTGTLPVPKILSVKPPRTLAKEPLLPGVLAANAAWARRIAHGAVNPLAFEALAAGTCRGFAPEDWKVAEAGKGDRVFNLVSPDGASHAIYKIEELGPGQDADRAALSLISAIFGGPVAASVRETVDGDFRLFHFGAARGVSGFALYHISSGNMLSLWIAGVPASDVADLEPPVGAIALSIRCASGLTPPPGPKPPDLPATAVSAACLEGACGEGDFAGAYLRTLHLGFVHAANGDVFLVRPPRDLWQTGPDGPGFYRQVGGMVEKLEPGLPR